MNNPAIILMVIVVVVFISILSYAYLRKDTKEVKSEVEITEVDSGKMEVSDIKKMLSEMDEDKLIKLWLELPISSDITDMTSSELDKRGYFERRQEEKNTKAEKIFNKYK